MSNYARDLVYIMREIKSEIEIFSTVENVWRILTDFNKYHQWNPFIDYISGELKRSSKLKVHQTERVPKRNYI